MAKQPGTLARWPEARIVRAMRAWRRGCGATLPWFRATPFAAAHHYRDRTLEVTASRTPPSAVGGLAASLPTWDHTTFWVVDAPATTALWLAHVLRRTRGLAFALALNGWYDTDGALDGRATIALLLALGERPVAETSGEAGLICERERLDAPVSDARLDNRYHLNDEELPSLEQLRRLRRRRVCVFSTHETAPDISAWADDLREGLTVELVPLRARAA